MGFAYNRIVALVTQMLELHPRLRAAAQAAADREMLQRQIDATDKQTAHPAFWVLPRWSLRVSCRRGVTEEEVKVV